MQSFGARCYTDLPFNSKYDYKTFCQKRVELNCMLLNFVALRLSFSFSWQSKAGYFNKYLACQFNNFEFYTMALNFSSESFF